MEVLGSHDPHKKVTVLKEERIKYWLGKGATMSDTAHNLLVSKGVISGSKRRVKIPAKKVEEALVEETKVEEMDKKEDKEEAKAEEANSEETK